jgi:2-polyprenyl-6-methoxyphenol hydroxylase-like FAD-dependent oxidoreductase
VVVVGAGPAGSALALQLARAGVAVELVESRNGHEQLSRGDGLMPSGLEALDQLGLGEALAALPQRPLRSWEFWLEQRPLFAVAEPIGGGRHCTLISTAALLQALLQEAQRHPSFHWHQGCGVDQLRFAPGRPDPAHAADEPAAERVVGVVLDDGSVLEADLVVACDGRQSQLRQRAGLPMTCSGLGLELLWFTLPATAGIGPEQPDPAVPGFMTLLAGGAIGSACRGARGELQLAWLLHQGDTSLRRSHTEWAERLAQLAPEPLAQRLRQGTDQLSEPMRVSVQVGLAPRWCCPGLLLLGDAAHPMSPVRAQGINMALRDSLVAAGELLAASGPAELDAAAGRVQRKRLPEIQRMQALQSAEARQGALLGRTALLRSAAAGMAPLAGPLAQALWTRRQRPLRW